MPTVQISASDIVNNIEPGIIYLTKGSVQQIKYLLPDNVVTECHYNPTTNTFRSWLVPDLFGTTVKAKIIFYPKVEGTGRVKNSRNTAKDKYGSVPNQYPYAVPNDQTVKLPNDVYFFIVLTDPITGEIKKEHSKVNLEGDFIRELDLRHVVFSEEDGFDNELPLTSNLLKSVSNKTIQEYLDERLETSLYSEYFHEVNPYIKALTSSRSTTIWYNLGRKGVYYKYFLVNTKQKKPTDQIVPLILNGARAWCLNPYLVQFVSRIRMNEQTASFYLAKFASWIFLTSTCYATPGANGLYWYEPASPKKLGYWVFKPSREAKLALPSLLEEC